VRPSELAAWLEELYRDKLALRQRHVAAARWIEPYDFNNTYQYIIAREDMHLAWLRDAIAEFGGSPAEVPEPAVAVTDSTGEPWRRLIREDAEAARAFVRKWRERVPAITHARHRRMCEVILGETEEHQRFFELALAGRTDLLGRRHPGAGAEGRVLPTRWVE
jgi:hypothetical protein